MHWNRECFSEKQRVCFCAVHEAFHKIRSSLLQANAFIETEILSRSSVAKFQVLFFAVDCVKKKNQIQNWPLEVFFSMISRLRACLCDKQRLPHTNEPYFNFRIQYPIAINKMCDVGTQTLSEPRPMKKCFRKKRSQSTSSLLSSAGMENPPPPDRTMKVGHGLSHHLNVPLYLGS